MDANVSYGFKDNISNAVSSRDIFEDQFIAANLNIGKLWVPYTGKSVVPGGHLGTENFNDTYGLDRYSYGALLTYIQRLGLGAYTPRLGIGFSADKRDFQTNSRDGWLYRTNIGLEKRFLPQLHAKLELTAERRAADASKAVPYSDLAPGDVFNQSNNELAASMDYTLENNSVISVRYFYRDGEVDASTNPGSEFFGFSKAIAKDFQLCDSCGQYAVYLIDASSHSFMLDWNWALGKDTSISANYERRVANANGGITYTGNSFIVQLDRRL